MRTPQKSATDTQNLQTLAGAGLAYLASDEEMLWRFLDLSGLLPDQLRGASQNPQFLRAILEHILSEDRLVEGLAATLAIDPTKLAQKCSSLVYMPTDDTAHQDPWVDP